MRKHYGTELRIEVVVETHAVQFGLERRVIDCIPPWTVRFWRIAKRQLLFRACGPNCRRKSSGLGNVRNCALEADNVRMGRVDERTAYACVQPSTVPVETAPEGQPIKILSVMGVPVAIDCHRSLRLCACKDTELHSKRARRLSRRYQPFHGLVDRDQYQAKMLLDDWCLMEILP